MDLIKLFKDILGITKLEQENALLEKQLIDSEQKNTLLLQQINGLKDFETVADLEAWFDGHDELRMPSPNLCDDYSRESRMLAEMDGYFLSCELVYQGACYGVPVFTQEDVTPNTIESVYHIANMAIVTDTQECFYVDLAWGKLIRLCNFYQGGKY